MVIAVILTLGSSAIWGIWTWQREEDFFFDTLSREGEVLVSTMAIPIINALLYEELGIISEGGLLDNFINEIMSSPRLQTRYAFVLDEQGRVLAHNRLAEFGSIYDDPLSIAALQAEGFQQTAIRFEGERVADMAMPLAIAGKRWGCLRVGISMEPAYAQMGRLVRQILLFSTIFSAGALVIYWFIGTWLARPIQTLTRNMENIGTRFETPAITRFRNDEIGQLQHSFAQMLERLKSSEAERAISVSRMLDNERIASVGRLVSGVAHEVNNPLAGIESTLYQIENKGGPEIKRYVDLVRQSIERIGRIVGQLSDLSRAGTIITTTVDSSEFFNDLAMVASMALKDINCRLVTINDCPAVTLKLDRDKVHQVVLNLMLNAIDATCTNNICDSGGIELRAALETGAYTLKVANIGPPIPDEVAQHMFTPFFTTKKAGKGSGMGLAISKGIAENHGGSLDYQRVGNKTVFTLALPVTESMQTE